MARVSKPKGCWAAMAGSRLSDALVAPGGDDAGIDAVPAEFAAEPRELDLRAMVHDDRQPRRLGAGGGLIMAHADLHPDRLGAEPDRLIDDRGGCIRLAENIDHIDRHGHIGEAGIAGL